MEIPTECPICFVSFGNTKHVSFACCCQVVCLECLKKISDFKRPRCPYCNHAVVAVSPTHAGIDIALNRVEEPTKIVSCDACVCAFCLFFFLFILLLIFLVLTAGGRLVK